MPTESIQQKVMHAVDKIKLWGAGAKEDLRRLCTLYAIAHPDACSIDEYTDSHLKVCEEVKKLWLTTDKFKVGDKVYVVPTSETPCDTCIRAVVTEVSTDGWGYHLRAFKSDLPGIYMFNIWDKDLVPRKNKTALPTPKAFLITKR